MSQKKKPFIILTGPTAVGKTGLSIALAKAVGASVISADSMQVYRGMDIGSAKISRGQMQGIPHYLIDVLEPEEEFHVVRFQELAKQALAEIYASGRIPLIVGGTGFYIQALLYDIDFTSQEEDVKLRRRYAALAKEKGNAWLHERLREVDPDSAGKIHPNNVRRVIRALEFYEQTGTPIFLHNEREREKTSPYAFCYFVLTEKRERLYARINERVDAMLRDGLVDEVARLRAGGCRRDMVSMQGLGYKELLAWMDGEISYEEAVTVIKRDTRHFAKRQLTWFRREKNVIWIDKDCFDDEEKILAFMLEQIKAGGLL